MLESLFGGCFSHPAPQTDVLSLIGATVRDGKTEIMLSLSSEDAQIALDKAWDILGSSVTLGYQSKYCPSLHSTPTCRSTLRRISVKLALKYNILPSTMLLRNIKRIDPHCRYGGAFADVYYAEYRDVPVALKRVRIFATTSEEDKQKKMKELCAETLLWKGLSHPNVLPFLGVADVFKGTKCMVLLWRPKTIRQHWTHLRTRGSLSVRVVHRWLYQIALGLAYLHDEGVIHGDLHGGNVLVDEEGRPQLADFGMAVIANATPGAYHSMRGGGAVRWAAPELLNPALAESAPGRPTTASDIYSFGCLSIELYTGTKPFPSLGDFLVATCVLAGERPPRPSLPEDGRMGDEMWRLVETCWASDLRARPQSRDVPEGIILATPAKIPIPPVPIKALVPTHEVIELPTKRKDQRVLDFELSENYIVFLTQLSIEVYPWNDLVHHDTLDAPRGEEFYDFAAVGDTIAVCSSPSVGSRDCTIHIWDLARHHCGLFTIHANSVWVVAVTREDAGDPNIHAARPTFLVVYGPGPHGIGALTAPDTSPTTPVNAAPLMDSEFYQRFSFPEKAYPLRHIIARGRWALACCNDSMIRQWNLLDGSCTHVIEIQDQVKSLSIDPFDRGMACARLNSQVVVWDFDVLSEPRTWTLELPSMSSESRPVIHLNHVIKTDQSGKVHIWTHDFKESQTLSHGNEAIIWLHGMQRSVVTVSQTKLMVWDIVTGAELQSFDLKNDRWGGVDKDIWRLTSRLFESNSHGLTI